RPAAWQSERGRWREASYRNPLLATFGMAVEAVDYVDLANDMPIELLQLLCGHPELFVLLAAHDPPLELRRIICVNSKAGHISPVVIVELGIPSTRNLNGVNFMSHRIEDRLFR